MQTCLQLAGMHTEDTCTKAVCSKYLVSEEPVMWNRDGEALLRISIYGEKKACRQDWRQALGGDWSQLHDQPWPRPIVDRRKSNLYAVLCAFSTVRDYHVRVYHT